MTIAQFKKLIKGLPNDMDIAIEIDDECIMPICFDTQIVSIEFNDNKEKRNVLVIAPCYCEDESDEINSKPHLN